MRWIQTLIFILLHNTLIDRGKKVNAMTPNFYCNFCNITTYPNPMQNLGKICQWQIAGTSHLKFCPYHCFNYWKHTIKIHFCVWVCFARFVSKGPFECKYVPMTRMVIMLYYLSPLGNKIDELLYKRGNSRFWESCSDKYKGINIYSGYSHYLNQYSFHHWYWQQGKRSA